MRNTEKLLSFGITGSVSPSTPLNRNPSYLLSHLEVQKLLIQVAGEPRSRTFIESALDGTLITLDDLVQTGLLKQAGERFRISFILFLQQDLATIKSVAGKLSANLAAQYLDRAGKFQQILQKTTAEHNSVNALAFILIGCFSLDWDGLQITSELDYRTEPRPTKRGDRYIAWAEERQYEDVREVYWGSHNDYYADCVLTTFGDHCTLPRTAFPDLGWEMDRSIYKLELQPALEQSLMDAFSPYISEFNEQLGRLMLALARGTRGLDPLSEILGTSPEHTLSLLDLLEELHYIEGDTTSGFKPLIPVLPAADAEMIDEVLTRSGEILVDWLPEHMDELQERLGNLTPLKYGLTFQDIFSQIWHYLFGLANQHMVKAGFFADPYDPKRQYQGFIPVVWHPDVMPEETTF